MRFEVGSKLTFGIHIGCSKKYTGRGGWCERFRKVRGNQPKLFRLLLLSFCCLVILLSSCAVPETRSVSRRTPSVGTTLSTYHGHTNWVAAVAWSPDGKYLASAGLDTTVQLWNATTGKALLSYIGHAIAWSPDGKHLASVGFDKTV